MVGTDIRNMTAIMNETLLNTEVLRINQDDSRPGDVVVGGGCGGETWRRFLRDGSLAVAVPNQGNATADVAVCLSDFGNWSGGGEARVRDVWRKTNATTSGGRYARLVPSHGTLLLVLAPLGAEEPCSLNGELNSGVCVCDPGWSGAKCSALAVAPSHVLWPQLSDGDPRSHDASSLSWGGSVLQDATTKRWHGWFNAGCQTPTSFMHT